MGALQPLFCFLIGLNTAAFVVSSFSLPGTSHLFLIPRAGATAASITPTPGSFHCAIAPNNIWYRQHAIPHFIGRDVETIIGSQFLFCLFGAFSGELGHLFLMPSNCVLFGASGGVAAIFIAYATILPELEMTTLLLFMVPVRLKMRRLAQIALVGAVALLLYDRSGAVGHSAFVGGAIAGWFYAHLLGFGRTSLLQRVLRQRRLEAARLQSMRADQFVAEEIDPLLEKISQRGLASLSRRERRLLEQAREKMLSGNAP